MNVDPLAEYAFTHSPYHYAYNNPIYYIDPDGMMGIPMAVTSLGMGINGVADIRSGGNTDELKQQQPKPDPQYPNTSGIQQLDEVVVVAKKKEKGCDDCPSVWGYGTEELGNKRGTRKGDFDMPDIPLTGTHMPGKTPNNLMNFLRDILDFLDFVSRGNDANKKYTPNESTMEKKNDEPVDPPEPKEYYVRTHESWTEEVYSDKRKAGGTSYINTITTLKEAKKDSAALMKIKPNNSLRVRDSVTIHKVNK